MAENLKVSRYMNWDAILVIQLMIFGQSNQLVLMDIIPLKPELIKGSHGRPPENPDEMPIILSSRTELIPNENIQATDLKDILMAHLF